MDGSCGVCSWMCSLEMVFVSRASLPVAGESADLLFIDVSSLVFSFVFICLALCGFTSSRGLRKGVRASELSILQWVLYEGVCLRVCV